MKEIKTTLGKVRLQDDAKVEDIDLWLQSGTAKVSRTALLNHLVEAFHKEITGKEPTLETIAECITSAVKIGRKTVDNQRFGN
jgi:hypothetical protein